MKPFFQYILLFLCLLITPKHVWGSEITRYNISKFANIMYNQALSDDTDVKNLVGSNQGCPRDIQAIIYEYLSDHWFEVSNASLKQNLFNHVFFAMDRLCGGYLYHIIDWKVREDLLGHNKYLTTKTPIILSDNRVAIIRNGSLEIYHSETGALARTISFGQCAHLRALLLDKNEHINTFILRNNVHSLHIVNPDTGACKEMRNQEESAIFYQLATQYKKVDSVIDAIKKIQEFEKEFESKNLYALSDNIIAKITDGKHVIIIDVAQHRKW